MKNLSYTVVAYLIGGGMVGGYWVYLYWRLIRLDPRTPDAEDGE